MTIVEPMGIRLAFAIVAVSTATLQGTLPDATGEEKQPAEIVLSPALSLPTSGRMKLRTVRRTVANLPLRSFDDVVALQRRCEEIDAKLFDAHWSFVEELGASFASAEDADDATPAQTDWSESAYVFDGDRYSYVTKQGKRTNRFLGSAKSLAMQIRTEGSQSLPKTSQFPPKAKNVNLPDVREVLGRSSHLADPWTTRTASEEGDVLARNLPSGSQFAVLVDTASDRLFARAGIPNHVAAAAIFVGKHEDATDDAEFHVPAVTLQLQRHGRDAWRVQIYLIDEAEFDVAIPRDEFLMYVNGGEQWIVQSSTGETVGITHRPGEPRIEISDLDPDAVVARFRRP